MCFVCLHLYTLKQTRRAIYIHTPNRIEMKVVRNAIPRVRALHRLAKSRRWPGFLVASLAQGIHGDFAMRGSCDLQASNSMDMVLHMLAAGVENAIHVGLLYLSYTLL